MIRFLAGLSLSLAPMLAAAQPIPALPPPALTEAVDPGKTDYLKRHVVASGPTGGPLALRLPARVYSSKLILLGESHGSAAPQAVDLQLLTELNRRAGLRDYVAEVDPVQAEHLNAYLSTGDEAELTRVFSAWASQAQWGNRTFQDKIRKIRTLNRTLPENSRIRFWGLDAIQDWPLLADWLQAAGATPDRAALAARKTEAEKAKLVLTWLDGAKAGDPVTLAALRAGLNQRVAGGGREAVIFATYARLVKSDALGDRPAYGLWGVFHVLKSGVNGAQPFAMRVRQSDLPAARSTVSIALLLFDSAVVIPAPKPGGGMAMVRTEGLNADGPAVKVAGAADLRAATRPHTVSIFDLGAPRSPYADDPDFVTAVTTIGQNFTPDDVKAPATAFADFVGVVRNSDWAPPLTSD